MPCDLVDSYRRFRGNYCLPVRSSRSQTLNDSSLQRSVWFVYNAEVSPFSSIETLNDWSSSHVPEGPQRNSEWRVYMISCAPMCIQGSPVATQTPAHWNLIGRSMTAPPSVLSPSSILPPLVVSLRSWYRKKNHLAFKRCYYFSFLNLFFNCLSPGVLVFPEYCDALLVAFAKLPKAAIISTMSVRPSFLPSVRMERLGSHGTGIYEIWYFSIFGVETGGKETTGET